MIALALQAQPGAPVNVGAVQNVLADQWLDLLRALLVIVAAIVLRRIALNWTGSAMRRARIDMGTQILLKRGLSVAVVVATLVIVLGTLGVSTAGLVTVVGAVGLAFSLAIQDILKNFFSGVYLLLERPFRVGDTIRVKDQQGLVENIGVRTTTLRTADNVQVLVPNAIVFAEVVANHSHERPHPPDHADAQVERADAILAPAQPQATAADRAAADRPRVDAPPAGPHA